MRRPLLALLLLAPLAARGDQCAWTSQAQVERAAEALHKGVRFIPWCEPCGEARPTAEAARPVKQVRAARVKDQAGYWELSLNGEPVDLAYVFVETAPGEFTNLASLAGCPAQGVSRTLRLPAKR